MTTERYYAYDIDNNTIVYRKLGFTHGDGQVDSDDNPVWLEGDAMMLDEENIFISELESIDPEAPHVVPPEYQ